MIPDNIQHLFHRLANLEAAVASLRGDLKAAEATQKSVPFDWSKLSVWLHWVAKDLDGKWYAFENPPYTHEDGWDADRGSMEEVHTDYTPKQEVHWRNSKMLRPT